MMPSVTLEHFLIGRDIVARATLRGYFSDLERRGDSSDRRNRARPASEWDELLTRLTTGD